MSSTDGNPVSVSELQTPALLLDEERMTRNIERLKKRLSGRGPVLRPHVKTSKCIHVARRMMSGTLGPLTVSTLNEAEQFAETGARDILYAVGIAPSKLDRVIALRERCDLSIALDSIEQANAVVAKCGRSSVKIPVLIEIDCDGHRSGVCPGKPVLLDIARALVSGVAELRGVMTHAGASYNSSNQVALQCDAERERIAVVNCATAIRDAGMPCSVVSVGSTPTAHFARDFSGVTEVRAGVFVFFDLVMAGIGVCTIDDIAISVLATVIGHQSKKGWTIIDAGWMALSRDRGTAAQAVDCGFGLVCNREGVPISDLVVKQVNQEHGVIASRSNGFMPPKLLPVGSQV